jgi:hypothetical protein
MEHSPSPFNHNKMAQVPLFVSDLPKENEELSNQNILDIDAALLDKLTTYTRSGSTISGRDFSFLFKDAAVFGVNDATLKKYLKARNVEINSHEPPEEKSESISYH